MAEDETRYELKTVRAIRGTEAMTAAKWEKDGWEAVSQSPGMLQTQMTFRRPKPKTPWRLLVALGAAVLIGLIVLAIGNGTARSTAPIVAATAAPTATPRSFAQPIATTTAPTPTPLVAVPNVVGASYQDASASLAALGLRVEANRSITPEEAATTSVTAQSHSGEVAPGTKVRLTVADPAPAPAPAAPAEDASSGSTGGGSGAGGSVYYANCKEAKAAGAAPLYVGDPGYRSKLDGDGDGIACEK